MHETGKRLLEPLVTKVTWRCDSVQLLVCGIIGAIMGRFPVAHVIGVADGGD